MSATLATFKIRAAEVPRTPLHEFNDGWPGGEICIMRREHAALGECRILTSHQSITFLL
jgi:hypothetical protein